MSLVSERPANTVVQTRCCLCGDVAADLIRQEELRTIVRCRGCRMVFCANISYSDVEAMYEEDYWGGSSDVGYAEYLVHPEVHAEWNRHKFLGIKLAGKQGPGRLLDVGCATGEFVEAAANAGWDAHGLEISRYAGEIGRKRGRNIHTGTLLDAPYEDGTFDVVTFWDVIEHVPDPVAELKRIHALLKPGGVVVLATPNVDSLRGRREKENWHGYRVSLEHIYFFSPASLKQVLTAAGFVRTRSDTFMIDERIRVLLNPWSDCSSLPVNIRGSRFYHIWDPNPMTLIHSVLERMGCGHVLLSHARKEG